MNSDNLKKINEKLNIIIDELRKKTDSGIVFEMVLSDMQKAVTTFEEPLNVMIMGEFSTGKSSFINALIGQEILKTNDTPTTAVITKISYGNSDKVLVHYVDGRLEEETTKKFEKLTSVTKNKKKNKIHENISYVERFIPVDYLKNINIIDSPGLNDTCKEHVEVTKRFVNNTDMILWIFTIQNAGTKSEVEALENLSEYLKPIGIVNKIDMLDDEDDSLEDELQDISNRLGNRVKDLIGVSSKMALQGKLENNNTLITESNITQINQYIIKNIIPSQEKIKTSKIVDKTILSIDSIADIIDKSINDLKQLEINNYEKYVSERMKYTELKMLCSEIFDLIVKDAVGQDKHLLSAIDLYHGLTGIDEKDKASKIIKDLAIRKNIKAQYLLGGYYYDLGKYDKAIYWYRQAADAGLINAQFAIGISMFDKDFKENAKISVDEASKWLIKAGNSGLSHASFICGKLLLEIDANENFDLGFNLIYKSAVDGVTAAQVFVANMLYKLNSNEKKEEAFSWLEKAAMAKNNDALYTMGLCYYEGLYPVEKNFYKARKYWEEASNYNDVSASITLAKFYEIDVRNDKLKQKYYDKAVELVEDDDEENLYKIGMMTEDDKKSFKYLKKSADLEYSDAILEIAYRYEIGKGVLSNVNKSIEYLHKVEHIPEALYHLGRLAYNNNEPTAYEYLKKAYEMNKHIKAGYYLALCYEAGLGCLCDIHKSLKIYDELLTLVEILSDRAWIIHSKAYCYKKLGNIETAIKLFEDSASMGEELSYQALGNIFFDNDRKRALKYYLKIKEKSDEINQKIQVCKNIYNDDNINKSYNAIQNIEVGSIIKFGSYPQNSKYKKEPIEWRVLAVKDDKALIISQYALDCKQYNEQSDFTSWEECTLRKWLNNDFLNSAFDSTEQNLICLSTVMTDKNQMYSTNQSYDTEDKVFLLSTEEAEQYFKNDEDRKCNPTKFAINNGAWQSDKGQCWWWLRSIGYYTNNFAAFVFNGGSVHFYGNFVNLNDGSVRPAFWINIKAVEYVNNGEDEKIEPIHFKKDIDLEHSESIFFRDTVSSRKIDNNIEIDKIYTDMNVNELYKLALDYKKDSKVKAKKIFEEILNKLNAHENKYLIGKIYKELGLIAEESKDYQKAFSYYKKSADNENDEGKYYLALCYMRGYGVKEDFSIAKALLSTIQYLPKAKSVLSDITHLEKNKNSHIEKKEVKTPRELYEEAIKYKNGDCVAKNNQQAINIFKRILNIKDAFNNRKLIGDVYNQLGVIAEEEYNYNEAFDWYQKSANCNYDYGTYNLAMCYVSGIGTQKDDRKAARIFSSIKYLPEASEMLNKLLEKPKESNKQNESTVPNDFVSDVMKKITNFFFE